RALDRSCGQTAARGLRRGGDLADFLAGFTSAQITFAAPIPELKTVFNGIVHEYCVIRNDVANGKFPAINFDKYLQLNAADIEALEDESLKKEMQEVLLTHGWKGKTHSADPLSQDVSRISQKAAQIRSRLNKTLIRIWPQPLSPITTNYFDWPCSVNELE